MAFPLQTYGLFSFQLPLFPSICDIIARVHLISVHTSVSYGFNTPYCCDMLQQVERMNERTIRPSRSRSWNDLIIFVAPQPGFQPGTFESAVRRSTSVLSVHHGPNAQWWGYNPQTMVFSHETKHLFEWSDLEPAGFELKISQSWSKRCN